MTDAVTAWRLFALAALSGEGAYRRGGRWNLPGTRVVYCAESRALAALEALVHVEDVGDMGAVEWRAAAIAIPHTAIERPLRYPQTWRKYPFHRSTQEFGNAWAKGMRGVALRVPSAVVPGEFNYLLNPAHPEFGRLTFGHTVHFSFDPRLAR